MANIWDTCSYNAEENSEVPFQGVALPRYMVIGCNHPISMVESNQIKPPTKSSLLLQSSIFIISNYIHIYPNIPMLHFVALSTVQFLPMVFQPSMVFFDHFDKLQLQLEGDRRIKVWAHQTGVALLQLQGPHRGIVGDVGVLPKTLVSTVSQRWVHRGSPGYTSNLPFQWENRKKW